MSKQFITPVSMKVTKEQYERDLKEPLKDLGYITLRDCINFDNSNLLVTNFANVSYEYGTSRQIDGNIAYNRTYINHYNPELFLALAAMTKGNEPIIGEYVIASIGTVHYLVKYNGNNNNYKVTSYKWLCLDNDSPSWINSNNLGSFHYLVRKATKDELIKYMTVKEEFVLPEKWTVEVYSDEEFHTVREYLEEFDNSRFKEEVHSRFYPFKDGDYVKYYIGFAQNNRLFYNHHIINGGGDKITFEQFKKYVLKEEDMIEEEKESRFPFKLHHENAQSIIDIACSTWKDKLAKKWATDIVLNKWIDVSYIFYKEMRKACTKEQHEVFDEIFGKDTLKCVFKQGEYIVYDNRTYHVETTDDGNGRVQLRSISFEGGRTIRFVSIEDINKNAHLWDIYDTKDGEPVWCNTTLTGFVLRYSNGHSEVYNNQKVQGKTTSFSFYRPFDPFNLPYNE